MFPRSDRFWREWTGSLAEVRTEIVSALEARDRDRLIDAVNRYHESAVQRIATSPESKSGRLSDPRFAGLVSLLVMDHRASTPADKFTKRH
jgi:hypothetical protein